MSEPPPTSEPPPPSPPRHAGAATISLMFFAIVPALIAILMFAGSINYAELSGRQSDGATAVIATLIARALGATALLVLGLRRDQHPTVRAGALIGGAYLLATIAGR